MPPRSDASLIVHQVAAGDVTALRGLYDRYAGSILAVANRILRNRSEAEEVVQDVFVEVWRRARTYDGQRGSVDAWVMQITRTRTIDRIRARGSAERAYSAKKDVDALEAPPLSALRVVEQNEAGTRVRAALASLPPEQRAVIEGAFFEGLSQTEIATKLGEPLGTVKSRVRMAMEKLGRSLKGEDSSSGSAR